MTINPEDQLAVTQTSDGHYLSRQQIAKHGKDRYPTPEKQARKLLEEVGELLLAIGEAIGSLTVADAAALGRLAMVRGEYADVGLALHALGDKLGLDLIGCMRELVENDTREFD